MNNDQKEELSLLNDLIDENQKNILYNQEKEHNEEEDRSEKHLLDDIIPERDREMLKKEEMKQSLRTEIEDIEKANSFDLIKTETVKKNGYAAEKKINTLTNEEKETLSLFIKQVEEEGLEKAIKTLKNQNNPFISDLIHDVLYGRGLQDTV